MFLTTLLNRWRMSTFAQWLLSCSRHLLFIMYIANPSRSTHSADYGRCAGQHSQLNLVIQLAGSIRHNVHSVKRPREVKAAALPQGRERKQMISNRLYSINWNKLWWDLLSWDICTERLLNCLSASQWWTVNALLLNNPDWDVSAQAETVQPTVGLLSLS